MNNDEKIIQIFFYTLSRTIQLKNLPNAKVFFTKSESSKIHIVEFENGLKKLGYDDKSFEYEFIIRKYQNFHDRTVINLDVIIQEFEGYQIESKKNTKSNIHSKTINQGVESNQHFKINTGNNFENTDKSNYEEFGVTKYINTPPSGGISNNNYNNNFNNYKNYNSNILVQDEEYGISSNRRNRTTNNNNNIHSNIDRTSYENPDGNNYSNNYSNNFNNKNSLLDQNNTYNYHHQQSNYQINKNSYKTDDQFNNYNTGPNSYNMHPNYYNKYENNTGLSHNYNEFKGNKPMDLPNNSKPNQGNYENINNKQFTGNNLNNYEMHNNRRPDVNLSDIPRMNMNTNDFNNDKNQMNNSLYNSENRIYYNTSDNIGIYENVEHSLVGMNDRNYLSENLSENNSRHLSVISPEKLKLLESLDKKMMQELQDNISYKKVTLYDQFHNFYISQKNLFETELKKLSRGDKFLSQKEFEDFFDSCLFLSDEEKSILLMDVISNNYGKYSCEDFLEKVKSFDKNEIINQIRNYNLNYNDYIVNLRSFIKDNKIDIRNVWIGVFQQNPRGELNGFINFIIELGLSYSEEEINYIFNKISEDGSTIIFKNFEGVIKRNPPNRDSKTNTNNTITSKSINHQNNKIYSNKYSVRDKNNFIELEKKNPQEVLVIVYNRLQIIEKRILDVLLQINSYKIFKMYEYLNVYFKSLGNYPENYFIQFDVKKQNQLTNSEFKNVMKSLQVNLTEEQMELLLQNLNNKSVSQGLYNYREFFRRISLFNSTELYELTRKTHHYFNDYLLDLREYIRENKKEMEQEWRRLFNYLTVIKLDQFIILLKGINYILSNDQEYKYLFQYISEDNMNISITVFLEILNIHETDTNAYVDSCNSSKPKMTTGWRLKLQNFAENDFTKTFQNNYKNLAVIFKDINIKIKSLFPDSNSDIVDYFETPQVNSNGQIEKVIFINMLSKLGLKHDNNLNLLLNNFTKPKTEMINLVAFIDAYNSFYYKERVSNNLNEIPTNDFDTPKTPPKHIETKKETPPKQIETNKEIVFKNYKRSFTNDDMDYIEEVVNYISDIILNEKRINIKEFFQNKDFKKLNFFSIKEFSQILSDDLDIDVEGDKENLFMFYDFLTNDDETENKKIGFSIIKIDMIISVFKQYSNDGIEVKETKNIDTNLSVKNNENNLSKNKTENHIMKKEEQILEEFSHFINNNRIKFATIFPILIEKPNETEIKINELKQAFMLSDFSIAHDEIELLIKYLDPYQKGRISLETLRNKIKQYIPEYFSKPFQFIDNQRNQASSSLVKLVNNKPRILNILSFINDYIELNKLTVEEFFNKFDKNHDENINESEFVELFSNMSGKFSLHDIIELYEYLDPNNQNNITINTFYKYFTTANMTQDERLKKVEISNKMADEINDLFNHFDLDKDNKISKDDFFKALKSYDNRTTLEDVNVIMKHVDKDGNNYVDRQEFFEIMESQLKQQIVMQEEEKEYVIRLFKEEDSDKLNYLTPIQMKHLLKEKLQCDLTEKEMEELIDVVDVNNDGMIDIDEFIKLLSSAVKNESMKNTIRQINLKRKINPMTFLNIFKGLPMSFIPSFINEEQKLFNLATSATLRPCTDRTGILYEDILPSDNKPVINSKNGSTSNINNNQFTLRQISTKVNSKISFETATGVSIPDEQVMNRKDNITGRIMKIALFNTKLNKFFGNSIHIQASWKPNYEDRWYFVEDKNMFDNNIVIRYNGKEVENVQVILEFVILVKKENEITEISCGYCSIDLKELSKDTDIKLQIKGGSPFKEDTISKNDIRTKRTGWSKFTQIFKGDVKSILPVKIKPFKEYSKEDKLLVDYLPSCIVIPRAALNMCHVYRKYIAKQIINNQHYSLKIIKSQPSIINYFCKIVDCYEAFKPMIDYWNLIVVEGATSSEKKDENYWESNLLDFVNRVYSVLYSQKFLFNELEPFKTSHGNDNLNSLRKLLIDSAIKFDKGKKYNK